jgi:hypothetical protein
VTLRELARQRGCSVRALLRLAAKDPAIGKLVEESKAERAARARAPRRSLALAKLAEARKKLSRDLPKLSHGDVRERESEILDIRRELRSLRVTGEL